MATSTPEITLLTVKEVAARLRISQSAAYALVNSGELLCVRVGASGGAIRILETDLAAYIEERRSTAKPSSRPVVRKARLMHLKV